VPAEKIVVGVPFYGHQWGEVADVNHGLMQHGKAIPHAFAPYHLIAKEMIGHGYVRYWDESAQAPYLYNADEHIFVTYDDPESLKLKCRYVLDEKLGGIMYWEHSSDTTGVLLGTIDEAFKSGAQQK
jgi:chitinase